MSPNASEILRPLWTERCAEHRNRVEQDRNTERQARNDYHDRAIYELFQNAADRAKDKVWIHFDPGKRTLSVANNGTPFSYNMERNNDGKVSDLISLCSIHLSSKRPGESIGNKGVGFKSVWQFSQRVRIDSRANLEETGWGFRLFKEFRLEEVERYWRNLGDLSNQGCAIKEKVKEHPDGIPSFYFPQDLYDSEHYFANEFQDAITVVTLEEIGSLDIEKLEKRIEEFKHTPLAFVEIARNRLSKGEVQPLTVYIKVGDHEEAHTTRPDGWKVFHAEDHLRDWDVTQKRIAEIACAEFDYALEYPSLAIAFPPEPDLSKPHKDNEKFQTASDFFFCYLPTECKCGFGVAIHADFWLDLARTSLKTESNEYNKQLVEAAADLLVTVLEENPILLQRADAPRFIDPRGCKDKAFLAEMRKQLFEKGRIEAILASMFPDPTPTKPIPSEKYRLCFSAMSNWYHDNDFFPTGYGTMCPSRYEKLEKELMKFFRRDVKLVPVVFEDDLVTQSAPLPSVFRSGDKYVRNRGEAIFIDRRKGPTPTKLPGSEVFKSKNLAKLAITRWDDFKLFKPEDLKLDEFNLNDIIKQISSQLSKPEEDGIDRQALLKLVISLVVDSSSGTSGQIFPGTTCRILAPRSKSNEPTLAENIAEISLPTTGDKWTPAKFCFLISDEESAKLLNQSIPQFERVDLARLWDIMNEVGLTDNSAWGTGEEAARKFAEAIGAWPCIPLVKEAAEWVLPNPFDAPEDLPGEDRNRFYRLLCQSWEAWDFCDPKVTGYISEKLQNSEWFPLQPEHNPDNCRFAAPNRIFRVKETDHTKFGFFAKHHEVSSEDERLATALGIVPVEVAPHQKLFKAIKYLREYPSPPSDLASTYRALTYELSKKYSLKPDDSFPILVRYQGKLRWHEQDEPERKVWFVGHDQKGLLHYFRNLDVAVWDEAMREEWRQRDPVRDFVPSVTIRCKDDAGNYCEPRDDPYNIKDLLTEKLPTLFAIAEVVAVGGTTHTVDWRDRVLRCWTSATIQYAVNVYQELRLEGLGASVHPGSAETGNVYYDPTRKSETEPVRIVHDIPLVTAQKPGTPEDKEVLAKYLPRFAAPLAIAIFGNRLFTPYFENYLRYGCDEDEAGRRAWLGDLGIEESLIQEMKQELEKVRMTTEERSSMIEKLLDLFPEGNAPTKDDIGHNWSNVGWYLGKKLNAGKAAVEGCLPERLRNAGFVIDPYYTNYINLREVTLKLECDLRRCWHTRRLPPASLEVLISTLRVNPDKKLIKLTQLERFDFDPKQGLTALLNENEKSCSVDNLDTWLESAKTEPNYLIAEEEMALGERIYFSLDQEYQLAIRPTLLDGGGARATKNQSDYSKEAECHSQNGLSAQSAVAKLVAKQISEKKRDGIYDPDQFWEKVKAEWKEILEHCKNGEKESISSKLGDLGSMPEDTEKWARYLNVGAHCDGPGYDVIAEEKGELLRVEVKLKRDQHDGIHLSDNERRKALDLQDKNWRIWLVVPNESGLALCDKTQEILYVLRQSKPHLDQLNGLCSEGWKVYKQVPSKE